MNLRNKSILLISPEAWGDIYVSKHYYATELAKIGNKVYFLNPETGNYKKLRVNNNLHVIDYKVTYKGLSRLPASVSAILIKKEISRIEKICDTHFDIIWNFDSSSFFNLKLVSDKFKISHIVDYSERKNIKLLNSTTDVCFASSRYILERQQKYNPNSFYIGHGYANLTNFDKFPLNRNDNSVKVGYLGNLLIKYLDWQLIYSLVDGYPEISFYFAGPISKSNLGKHDLKDKFLIKTINKANSHFIGPLSPSQISYFLKKMDILLVAYMADKYKKQLANPLKIIEYLGSGNAIVASWSEEYANETNLIKMVKSNDDYIQAFDDVVTNLNIWNNKETKNKRIALAMNNTYKIQLSRIENIIKHL